VEPPVLRIRLLGDVDLRRGDVAVPALESARAESLLAYLLIHRDAPQPRQRLAFVLWPDSTEAQARTNLRHVLHKLRRALPDADHFLEITPRTLQWRPDAPCWLDVEAFEEALGRARADHDPLGALREAVDVYTGDLVAGSYDDWLVEERERLRALHLDALERVAALLEERGDHAAALRYAERLVQRDPLSETTCRRLMRLHDALGDRARALRVYHACTGALERELGVEPSAATRELYEALLPAADGREPEPAAPTPAALIGRAAERARLTELWRAAEGGHAQLVLVTGEPGIGKTRLVEELLAWCAHRGVATAHARSYAAEGELAYGPVAAWLRSDRLVAGRGRLGAGRRAALARVLPELADERQPPAQPEAEQRQRLFDALAHALLAADEPVLLVADDVHWADDETLQFLHYLIRSAPKAPLLLLATARREEMDDRPALGDLVRGLRALERVDEIELSRLSRPETAVLAHRVAGHALDEAEADRLFGETDGNPLFVVETLRAGEASPRVQAVLESRLAALSPPARGLVGVAATIGREFTSTLLAMASGIGDGELVPALDELWRRRILREQGAEGYDFSHDKLREAAYAALGPARRRDHHLRAARALERQPAASAQIAAHYDRAGAAAEALPWYERAAAEARRVYANREALRLLERGLELLATLAPGPERDGRELELLSALLVPLAAVEGTVSERLTAVQRRVRALSPAPAPPLLRSVALTSLSQGRFDEARAAGAELCARGEADGDGVMVVEGHYVLGIAAFWRGELRSAREHFEAAVEQARPDHRATHLVRYGLDPNVVCLSRLGNTLWLLGDPDAAVRARDDALELAREIAHPATTATALVFAAMLSVDLGAPDDVRVHTAALRATSPEEHTRAAIVAVEVLEGYLDVLDGRHGSGIARLRRILGEARAAEHAPGNYAMTAHVMLEACAVAGDARLGLAVADQALATAGATRLWDAETHRRRAEFRAALGAAPAEIGQELALALQIAHEQGALALERRVRGTLEERTAVHRQTP
jgi:DNA-binding SARP family transcriptional activator